MRNITLEARVTVYSVLSATFHLMASHVTNVDSTSPCINSPSMLSAGKNSDT